MKINQAFTILSNAGGIRAARIITENRPKLSSFDVWLISRKLRHGVPVAKIIHKKWFYGMPFYTNSHTLDPRPDTETLVSAVIADSNDINAPYILDLGTGTGCIIAALVKNIRDARGVGIEKSIRAAHVARKNVRNLKLAHRISIKRASFENPRIIRDKFDIIVSNPPYITRGDTRVNDGARHDPKMALYAADNGTAAYRAIAKNARHWIHKNGMIYIEIGDKMADDVRNIFTSIGWKYIRAESDLAGIQRVLVFQF